MPPTIPHMYSVEKGVPQHMLKAIADHFQFLDAILVLLVIIFSLLFFLGGVVMMSCLSCLSCTRLHALIHRSIRFFSPPKIIYSEIRE